MSVRAQHNGELNWFVTFTCYEWLTLFDMVKGYDLVYKWFEYMKKKKQSDVLSYVIMPNHFHAILNLQNDQIDLNKLIGNGKRFIAYDIVERLKTSQYSNLLERLSHSVTSTERKKGQKHRVFENSFDAKDLVTKKFLFQKLNYIHQNPVRGKWRLVEDFRDYEHSSASYYELGIIKHYEPKNYKEVWFGY